MLKVGDKLQPVQIYNYNNDIWSTKIILGSFQQVLSCRELKSCGYRIKVMCDDAGVGGTRVVSHILICPGLMIPQPFPICKAF